MLHGRMGRLLLILSAATLLPGCLGVLRKLHYIGDAELQHYKHEAVTIDYPDVLDPPAEEAEASQKPPTVADRKHYAIRKMTLAEAVHLALGNNRVIRSATFGGPNPILANPDFAPSVYDVAIQESGVLFGRRGVEAALADFDAQFTTAMIWGRSETVQNNPFFGSGLAPGNTLVNETGVFRSQLEKQFAIGSTVRVAHDWDYLGTNSPATLFPSSYRGNIRAEYRHPLWAASGPEFTRIAGPQQPAFGAITGVSQGVVIARINADISVADFEANVRNLVKDVEDAYWDLYLAYRNYDAAVFARDSALRSWRDEKARRNVGAGDPLNEAQTKDQYYRTKAAALRSLGGADSRAADSIYARELRLRRLLGLPAGDGEIIQPVDDPITAEFVVDWQSSLAQALSERVELRRQKWSIKSLEFQLRAAESLTNPRLDFVTSYQVNGFGDRLLDDDDNDGVFPPTQGLRSAYETITQGNQTGWTVGFEFSMPFGFRSARAQVRNIELRLAKARELLAAQELEIAHELAQAVQKITSQYSIAEANYHRMQAARERLELTEARYEGGIDELDLVLRAQADAATAESAYYTALVEYNKAIADFHYRKGTLLVYNNVFLAEGEWVPQAYEDSLERARARSHAIQNPLLRSVPEIFALPGYTPQIELGWPGAAGEAPVDEADELPQLMPPPAPDSNAPSPMSQPATDADNASAPRSAVTLEDSISLPEGPRSDAGPIPLPVTEETASSEK